MRFLGLLFFVCIIFFQAQGQDYADARTKQLALRLDSLAMKIPHLNDTSRTNFIDATLPEFVRALGKAHQLNFRLIMSAKKPLTMLFMERGSRTLCCFFVGNTN